MPKYRFERISSKHFLRTGRNPKMLDISMLSNSGNIAAKSFVLMYVVWKKNEPEIVAFIM